MAEFKDERVDLSRSAADILNPGIPAIELKEQDPLVIAPLNPSNLTSEDLENEVKAKQDHYEKENLERSGEAGEAEQKTKEDAEARVPAGADVSTSQIDKGQEGVLSPAAARAAKESIQKAQKPAK